MGYFDDMMRNPQMDKAMPSFMPPPPPPGSGPPPGLDADSAAQAAGTAEPPPDNGMDPNGEVVDYRPGPNVFQRLAEGVGSAMTRVSNPILAGQNAVAATSVMQPRQGYASGGDGNASGVPSVNSAPGLPPGPLTTAVEGAPGITRTGNSYSGVGNATSAPDTRNYGAELAAARAADAASRQEGLNNSRNEARGQASRFDLANAEQAARVSAFRAANGADMVLAPENSGYDSQRREIGAAAARDAGVVAGLRGEVNRIADAAPGTRNYVDEFAKTQDTLNRTQLTGSQSQHNAVDVATKQQALEGQKRINDIGAKLVSETDPKKISALHSQLLALMGKDKPEDYQVIHAPGATHTDPTTLAITKDPDHVVIVNKRTGQAEAMNLGSQQGNDPVAALKALPVDAATKQAKAAIAAGASLAEVNKRLKAAGHPEL